MIGDKAAHTSNAGLVTPMLGPLIEAAAADAALFNRGTKGTGRCSMTAPDWVRFTSTPAAR